MIERLESFSPSRAVATPAAPGAQPAPETLPQAPAGVPAAVFDFEGAKVVAWFDAGKWNLHSSGCSAVASHLGTATRILFNPSFHDDTRPLIDSILAWQREAAASPA